MDDSSLHQANSRMIADWLPSIVIKVGGSLFDRPTLHRDLKTFLEAFDPADVVLVAGGGDSAEAVRTYDRLHHLGETISHRLALHSLTVTAELLRELTDRQWPVLDAAAFGLADETLPHSWTVTSDSIAARYAETIHASRLILLKSAYIPSGADWRMAVREGWVDEHFATMAACFTGTIEIVRLP